MDVKQALYDLEDEVEALCRVDATPEPLRSAFANVLRAIQHLHACDKAAAAAVRPPTKGKKAKWAADEEARAVAALARKAGR